MLAGKAPQTPLDTRRLSELPEEPAIRTAHAAPTGPGVEMGEMSMTECVMLGPVGVTCAVRPVKNGPGPALFATRCTKVRS